MQRWCKTCRQSLLGALRCRMSHRLMTMMMMSVMTRTLATDISRWDGKLGPGVDMAASSILPHVCACCAWIRSSEQQGEGGRGSIYGSVAVCCCCTNCGDRMVAQKQCVEDCVEFFWFCWCMCHLLCSVTQPWHMQATCHGPPNVPWTLLRPCLQPWVGA